MKKNIKLDLIKTFVRVIWTYLFIMFIINFLLLNEIERSNAWNSLAMIFFMISPAALLLWISRKIALLVEYRRLNHKESEKLQYQMKTYRSLESAKYEIEKNSHRLMRIVALMESENFQNPQLVEELSKIKVILKEEGYYINTGNVIFDYLITNKIKITFDFDTFKSMIAISKKEKYDRKEFISVIESLIDLYAGCNDVEMNLFEKSNFVICDICHSGKKHLDYEKWHHRYPNYEYELSMDKVGREHFKVIIE